MRPLITTAESSNLSTPKISMSWMLGPYSASAFISSPTALRMPTTLSVSSL